jgi:hypothetical protein
MDPFDIGTPVGTMQAYACMDEKVRMPKDKWFGLHKKTKELWDQMDDNDKLVILGYAKSSSPSPFLSRPLNKPPFPLKRCCNINLHEIPACDLLQLHTPELEPDPAPDEVITKDPSILNHEFKEDGQWEEVHEPESSFDKIGDYKNLVNVQNLQYVQCPNDHELNDDIIDPRVLDPQTSQEPHDPDNPELYDAKDKKMVYHQKIPSQYPPLLDHRP